MNKTLLILAALFSSVSVAGVYKCTDVSGNTTYQSSPCEDLNEAFEMNVKTGSAVDLNQQRKQQELAEEEKLRLQQQEQQRLQQIKQRKKAALAESELTQKLIKNNPRQYSAFAIPPYDPDKLPELVKKFEERLPEIEKFRRLAAQKALASGQCSRVEGDELNIKSTMEHFVFQIECSSGKSFFYNETDLTRQ
ncbi:DUF4124 domain-containing protein [Methylomarinum vadi]|uniref:DUF4124 domain-containing protein n=1 Tax=Methylomarinum vadi TaxID=438855 RepID=UPI0004DED2EF|nr:DUF4124 domain-containing protein [Methylomarinum vadi]